MREVLQSLNLSQFGEKTQGASQPGPVDHVEMQGKSRDIGLLALLEGHPRDAGVVSTGEGDHGGAVVLD